MDKDTTSRHHGLGLLGFFVAVGLIGSALVLALSFRDIIPVRNQIKVKGFSEQTILSDVGVWQGMFTTRGTDLKSAYEQLETARGQVQAWFGKQGVVDGTLRFSAVNTRISNKITDRGIHTNIIEGYELSQTVEITSSNVEMVEKLSKNSTSLIQEGVEFTSYSPRYYYTQIDSKKLDLLGAATRDAKARADQLAENSGSTVGRLISASQGVFQITPLYSTETAGYGVYDTSTIDKSVKAVVTVEYAIR